MIFKDVGQGARRIGQQGRQGSGRQSFESRVSRGKHSERTVTAQGINKSCSIKCRLQCRMFGTVGNDVIHGSVGQQDCVDHMHHTVVGHDVGYCHLGIVDEYTIGIDGHSNVFSQKSRGSHFVGQVGRFHAAGQNVVFEDVGQGTRGVGQQGGDRALGKSRKGCIGRCEHREGSCTAQVIGQSGGHHRSFQGRVIRAVHHHINHRGIRLRAQTQEEERCDQCRKQFPGKARNQFQ